MSGCSNLVRRARSGLVCSLQRDTILFVLHSLLRRDLTLAIELNDPSPLARIGSILAFGDRNLEQVYCAHPSGPICFRLAELEVLHPREKEIDNSIADRDGCAPPSGGISRDGEWRLWAALLREIVAQAEANTTKVILAQHECNKFGPSRSPDTLPRAKAPLNRRRAQTVRFCSGIICKGTNHFGVSNFRLRQGQRAFRNPSTKANVQDLCKSRVQLTNQPHIGICVRDRWAFSYVFDELQDRKALQLGH